MPHFHFKAYDQNGSLIRGEMEAVSREDVYDVLNRRGQFPLEIIERTEKPKEAWWNRDLFGGGSLPLSGLTLFTRELATLVKADLPIDEALKIVALQPLIPARIRRTTQAVLDSVRQGDSLSGALSARGKEFPEYYWRLIQAGEASGSLGEVLDNLAVFLEKSGEVRNQLSAALLYPAVLIFAAMIAIGIIISVLVPTVAPLFKDAGAEPPPTIRFLLAAQDFVSSYWIFLLAAIAGLVALVMAALRNPRIRLAADASLLRVPIVGGLISNRETALFSRTLSTLIRNGVAMLDAVRIAGSVLSNRAFSNAAFMAQDAIREGGSLSGPLVQSKLFSELAVRLIAVGEQTGQLDVMLLRVATIYEATVQRQLSRFLALLTPALTLIIGSAVGSLIISVMSAILSVNELAFK